MRRFGIIAWLWMGLLLLGANAGSYPLTDDTSISGDPVSYDDTGVIFKTGEASYSPRISWGKFKDEALRQLRDDAKNNPRNLAFVAPLVSDETPAERAKWSVITVKPIETPPRPSGRLGVLAIFSSPLGWVMLLILYGTNLFAAYEVAVYRNRPMATVCGLAAIPFFGVASPIYFLALPGRTPPEEAAPASGNAVDPAAFAPHSLASPAAARQAAPEEIAVLPDSSFAPPQPDLPEPVVFARGEFLFNRRFFETKLPGFFRVVLSEADKDLRIHIKSVARRLCGQTHFPHHPLRTLPASVQGKRHVGGDDSLCRNSRSGNPAQRPDLNRPLKSRIVFMGTAELACASLQALAAAPEFQVAAVVTQPDRPKGRDLKLQPSPVKQAALRAGLAVLQPERARDPAFLEELRRLEPDLMVVVAYGQLLPAAILTLPPAGCINVHASLLPKYRGAAPIQWAILNGESETGVTLMKMDEKLDTGDILTQRATAITPDDTAATLHDRLARIGAQLLVETLGKHCQQYHHRPPANRGAGELRAQADQGGRPPGLVAIRPFPVEPRSRLHSVAGGVHHVAGRGENADPQNLSRLSGGSRRRRARRGGAGGQGGNRGGVRRRRRIAHPRIATRRRPPPDRRRIPRRPPLAPRRPPGVKQLCASQFLRGRGNRPQTGMRRSVSG